MDRIRLKGLPVSAFQAEADKIALDALKAVPLLPQVIQKFHEFGLDRWLYCWNMAQSVRCGPNQMPTLYKIMQECCEILDMPEPELYVSNHPFTNAFTGGVERPYITFRNSALASMSDDELYHIMGHELGHIKAGHVLYKSIAQVLMPILRILGNYTLGAGDLVGVALTYAFFVWSKEAELTCDRTGLLCSQDFNVSARANLILTGGASRLDHELNTDAFLDQARAYQDMNSFDAMGKFIIFALYESTATHPLPVHRMQELDKWHKSGEFDKILRGEYLS